MELIQKDITLLMIYFYFLFICMFICHTRAEADGGRLEDGVGSDPPRARVTGGCELTNVNAWNQTQVFWRSSKVSSEVL